MINILTEPLKYILIQNAFIELLLISLLVGIMGTFLVLKNTAFISEGISHGVYPGIVLAFIFKVNPLIGAIAVGIFMIVSITLISGNKKISENNAIAIFFSVAFAFGIMLRSLFLKNTSIDLESFIMGNILSVSIQDIILTLVAFLATFLIVILFYKQIELTIFDKIFAQSVGIKVNWINFVLNILVTITIVVTIQAVGNILVLALLIIPASTARLLVKNIKKMILISIVVTTISSIIGLYLSYYLNLAPSASIVIVSALIFALANLW